MTLITEKDLNHMNAFPPSERAALMKKLMSMPPLEERVCEGGNESVRALWRLRADGLKLVDLEPQETAFTSVWYRNGRSFLSRQRQIAAMVVWEINPQQEVATFRIWQVR
jgi:hypothetical protein